MEGLFQSLSRRVTCYLGREVCFTFFYTFAAASTVSVVAGTHADTNVSASQATDAATATSYSDNMFLVEATVITAAVVRDFTATYSSAVAFAATFASTSSSVVVAAVSATAAAIHGCNV